MLWVFVVLTGVFALLLILQARAQMIERRAWTEERRELLNRIQRPEHIPVTTQSDFQVPEREPDEWAQVGQIVIDDKYGLDDD